MWSLFVCRRRASLYAISLSEEVGSVLSRKFESMKFRSIWMQREYVTHSSRLILKCAFNLPLLPVIPMHRVFTTRRVISRSPWHSVGLNWRHVVLSISLMGPNQTSPAHQRHSAREQGLQRTDEHQCSTTSQRRHPKGRPLRLDPEQLPWRQRPS